jgi:hypothetical protein
VSRDDNPADRNTSRVYYQRDGIRVTRDFLFVSGRRFSLSGVTDLRTLQSRAVAPELWWGFFGGNLAIVVAGWPVAHWAVFGLNATATAVFVIVLLRRRVIRRNELWASYKGQETRLLVMRDSERYGQVCRALLRAREARRSGPEQDACRVVG